MLKSITTFVYEIDGFQNDQSEQKLRPDSKIEIFGHHFLIILPRPRVHSYRFFMQRMIWQMGMLKYQKTWKGPCGQWLVLLNKQNRQMNSFRKWKVQKSWANKRSDSGKAAVIWKRQIVHLSVEYWKRTRPCKENVSIIHETKAERRAMLNGKERTFIKTPGAWTGEHTKRDCFIWLMKDREHYLVNITKNFSKYWKSIFWSLHNSQGKLGVVDTSLLVFQSTFV